MSERDYHRGPPAGFTLMEMVIVTLILGIFTTVAAGRFAKSLSYHRADSAAQRVRADLELARHRARMSSRGQSVKFMPLDNAYLLPGIPDLDHSASDYRVDLSLPPHSASIVSADFGGLADVTFDGYGVPTSGGTVVVQSGPFQKTISVDPTTGQANIP
jgi:prepilin-type N-terminal cleavage/methylation domain-containing protein